jgi:hypothetical protein
MATFGVDASEPIVGVLQLDRGLPGALGTR